jgi:hypothetical protein
MQVVKITEGNELNTLSHSLGAIIIFLTYVTKLPNCNEIYEDTVMVSNNNSIQFFIIQQL